MEIVCRNCKFRTSMSQRMPTLKGYTLIRRYVCSNPSCSAYKIHVDLSYDFVPALCSSGHGFFSPIEEKEK